MIPSINRKPIPFRHSLKLDNMKLAVPDGQRFMNSSQLLIVITSFSEEIKFVQ